MGVKKGVNALTKTARVFGGLVLTVAVFATVLEKEGWFALVFAVPIAIICYVGAWILDSFVE